MKSISCLSLALVLTLSLSVRADGPCLTLQDLARLNRDQLDAVFATGTVGASPVGFARGHILLRVDGRMPAARARLQELVWKGKVFYPDGTFVNQWVGFRALASSVEIGPSWYDGRPCLILEYPAHTPIFGNARDELREVSPGLWLGRFCAICPSGKLEGYFALERTCRK
jgi:hypothetical protein